MKAQYNNKYNPKKIEEYWNKKWAEENIYKTHDDTSSPKYYVLDMFPYPSGSGLHVGHPKGYIATDIISRMKTMQGYSVLHPMGWDAFGLPAENYAIKNKVHPRKAVEENIQYFKSQLQKLGLTYDWDREINTTDPNYYKWTQWIFLKLYEKGLAYESYEPINWCPSCQTGLANEDLEDGKCERCGSVVEKKPMRQWVLKITEYADRLLDDIDKLPGWEESIKEMQRNWIGRKEGALISFQISNNISTEMGSLEVFTTRPNTIAGAACIVVSPEHNLLKKLEKFIKNKKEVAEYILKTKQKSELERTDLNKNKSGLEIKGLKSVNPLTKEEIPIYTADYVLQNYGTGAIMAVPAHDQRDYDFAIKHKLLIKVVVKSAKSGNKDEVSLPYVGEGIIVDSDFLSGLPSKEAISKAIEWLEENNLGKKFTTYHIQDWVFSRQRYWGEPIPIIKCDKCVTVPVSEEELPVKLPEVENYEPTGTGESPLANIDGWVNTTCPKCGGKAKRETNTMPQWAGSSWYWLRYIDPHNDKVLVDKDKERYWSPVDQYVGGAEHATRHLIYARFWYKFLYDIGVVNYDEPFERLQHVGLILAEDGRKMSKRFGNVINPDDIIEKYGADALRIYEMFMGPFGNSVAWDTKGLVGVSRFLEKVWNLHTKVDENKSTNEIEAELNKTILKVEQDIEQFKFNTAVSELMILVNFFTRLDLISKEDYKILLQLLHPFAPYITEELWKLIGEDFSIYKISWPTYDKSKMIQAIYNIGVQINGKIRGQITVDKNEKEEKVKQTAIELDNIQRFLKDKEILNVVYVPQRVINIVTK